MAKLKHLAGWTIVLALFSIGCLRAGETDLPQQSPDAEKPASTDTTVQQQQDRPGEWLLAPIPIKSPAIGAGLEWAAARVFSRRADDESPPSVAGVGGAFTNNGTRAFALGGRFYLRNDKFRIATAAAAANVNFDFYGSGTQGTSQTFIPLNASGQAFIGEFLTRFRKNMYVGIRGQYRNVTMSLEKDRLDSSDVTAEPPQQVSNLINQITDVLFHQQTVSLGPRFQWDSRDNVYYPKKGTFMEAAGDFFAEGLGSKWTYQYYKTSFNRYQQLSEHQVIAFRAMGCAAVGDRIPIYDLCLYGTTNDLRGYAAGHFQDRRMYATQAEYRLMLPVQGFLGRFGVVAFGGVGGVGEKFSSMNFLPAGGAGLRFRLTKKNPINYRMDYAFGKNGNTLTIGILEAF